jgi:hypothetical protein
MMELTDFISLLAIEFSDSRQRETSFQPWQGVVRAEWYLSRRSALYMNGA